MRRLMNGFSDYAQIVVILGAGAAMLGALLRESLGTPAATVIALGVFLTAGGLMWLLDGAPRSDPDDEHASSSM